MSDINISELIKVLEIMKAEVGCDGYRIASHKFPSQVRFQLDDGTELQFQDLNLTYTGCGCATGVGFNLFRLGEDA